MLMSNPRMFKEIGIIEGFPACRSADLLDLAIGEGNSHLLNTYRTLHRDSYFMSILPTYHKNSTMYVLLS